MHRVLVLSCDNFQLDLTDCKESGWTYELSSKHTTALTVGYKSTTCCKPETRPFEFPKSEEQPDVMSDSAVCRVELLQAADAHRVFK